MFPHLCAAFFFFHRIISSIDPRETVLIGILNDLVLQLYMLTLGCDNGVTYVLAYALTITGRAAFKLGQFVYHHAPTIDIRKRRRERGIEEKRLVALDAVVDRIMEKEKEGKVKEREGEMQGENNVAAGAASPDCLSPKRFVFQHSLILFFSSNFIFMIFCALSFSVLLYISLPPSVPPLHAATPPTYSLRSQHTPWTATPRVCSHRSRCVLLVAVMATWRSTGKRWKCY